MPPSNDATIAPDSNAPNISRHRPRHRLNGEPGLLSRLASKPPSCEQDAGHSQARPNPARLPSLGPVDPPSPRLTILSLLLTIPSVAVLNGWRRVDPFPTPTLAMLLHIREHRGRTQGGAPPLIAVVLRLYCCIQHLTRTCRLATRLSRFIGSPLPVILLSHQRRHSLQLFPKFFPLLLILKL